MDLKKKLYQKCLDFVNARIDNIQQANAYASESANDETKSSAGDKHETGRAMAQLEQEKNSKQLGEALELKRQLDKINPEQHSEKITAGSLVLTNKGNFYIAISAGKLLVDETTCYAVSPASPIAVGLLGLKKGREYNFNGVKYMIVDVL